MKREKEVREQAAEILKKPRSVMPQEAVKESEKIPLFGGITGEGASEKKIKNKLRKKLAHRYRKLEKIRRKQSKKFKYAQTLKKVKGNLGKMVGKQVDIAGKKEKIVAESKEIIGLSPLIYSPVENEKQLIIAPTRQLAAVPDRRLVLLEDIKKVQENFSSNTEIKTETKENS